MRQVIDQAPGVYADVSDETYHRWAGASQSRLKDLMRSPAHALFNMTFERKTTEALKIGSALHTKVLQPEAFDARWLVNQDRKTSPDDAVTLGSNAYDKVNGMAAAIAAHPVASELLADVAHRELSLVWDDCESGVRCKARYDHVCAKRDIIIDIKTTEDASRREFEKAIFNYGYHIQGAQYLQAAAALEIKAKHFVLIAIEKTPGIICDGKPSHAIGVYVLDAAAIEAGAHELTELLARWKECQALGEWPAYRKAIVDISIPAWALKKYEVENE